MYKCWCMGTERPLSPHTVGLVKNILFRYTENLVPWYSINVLISMFMFYLAECRKKLFFPLFWGRKFPLALYISLFLTLLLNLFQLFCCIEISWVGRNVNRIKQNDLNLFRLSYFCCISKPIPSLQL